MKQHLLEAESGVSNELLELPRGSVSPARGPAPCFHGGAFFEAVGPGFDDLSRREAIINADVLDAWFPPAPGALHALEAHLPWLTRTSPPAACEGLLDVLSEARGVPAQCLVPGGGSSDLIFRALRLWLHSGSKVLLLDPTYGEYAHVLERVIGCDVARFPLRRETQFQLDQERFQRVVRGGFDWVILVNPNSPTGRHASRRVLMKLMAAAPASTRFWVDETYMEYVGRDESLESYAVRNSRVVVCKSMSKVYALSGLRAAYLCAAPEIAASVRSITPPWAMGLLAQVAAVKALQDEAYYAARYAETHRLREKLAADLQQLGWHVTPGVANFLLAELPANGPDAATLVQRCRERGLFLRDVRFMGTSLGRHSVRVAVKDAATNRRMLSILRGVL